MKQVSLAVKLVHDGERRARDGAVHLQTARQTSHKRRFPRAKLAVHRDYGAALRQRARELLAERFGLGFGVADKFHNPSASVSNSNFSNLALYTGRLPE